MAFSAADIRAVIDSAKARESGNFLGFLRQHHPDASDTELQTDADRALAVIESVPDLMEHASRVASERDLESMVEPVLGHAARYFTAPIDAIPEMTHGLVGLVDDAYFVLRTLEHMENGSRSWLGVDVSDPLDLLRDLLGPELVARLDRASDRALANVSESIEQLWNAVARPA